MQQVERVWRRRLRWRLAGAWMWPAFAVLTVVDGVVLALLPFYGDGPGGFVPALLLAGFLNLLAVAVLAPLGGRVLRRRRPDLPRLVAADYAGAWMLTSIAALLLAGGLVHRPSVAAEGEAEQAVAEAVHNYVVARRASTAAAWRRSTRCASSPATTAPACRETTRAAGCACSSGRTRPRRGSRAIRTRRRTRSTAGTAASAR